MWRASLFQSPLAFIFFILLYASTISSAVVVWYTPEKLLFQFLVGIPYTIFCFYAFYNTVIGKISKLSNSQVLILLPIFFFRGVASFIQITFYLMPHCDLIILNIADTGKTAPLFGANSRPTSIAEASGSGSSSTPTPPNRQNNWLEWFGVGGKKNTPKNLISSVMFDDVIKFYMLRCIRDGLDFPYYAWCGLIDFNREEETLSFFGTPVDMMKEKARIENRLMFSLSISTQEKLELSNTPNIIYSELKSLREKIEAENNQSLAEMIRDPVKTKILGSNEDIKAFNKHNDVNPIWRKLLGVTEAQNLRKNTIKIDQKWLEDNFLTEEVKKL